MEIKRERYDILYLTRPKIISRAFSWEHMLTSIGNCQYL
jgi:hypothetical protein